WNPELDNQPGKKDYPCTTAIQFLLRDDKLECHVRMRSNDVWWGLAYDAFMFTQLQLSICNALEVEAGPYYHQPVSLHLYDRDLEDVNKLHPLTGEFFHPTGFGIGGEEWWHIRNRARIIQGNGGLQGETLSEAWYRETIQKRMAHVQG
ncbi:MAG: thymidylate synthase, partial [Actinobacteria bacterium]|nr:thymidylate synthase [Actinomycetota bacterium]